MSSSNLDRLNVPGKGNSGSVSSYNSYTPQFTSHRPSKSGSFSRLTRTNTNTSQANLNIYESQSVKGLDSLSTARSSVSYLDKLWTQIDVLDDVKNMSDKVKEKGSFFNDKFTEELARLKKLQEKLLEVMATKRLSAATDKQQRQVNGLSSLTLQFSLPEDYNQEKAQKDINGKRLNAFFTDSDRNLAQFTKHSKELDQFIDELKQNLDDVAESMKRFDETTRDFW